jgi:hypothetical protein
MRQQDAQDIIFPYLKLQQLDLRRLGHRGLSLRCAGCVALNLAAKFSNLGLEQCRSAASPGSGGCYLRRG